MLKVEVVAKFVAERAHERSERSDLLTHRRPHPYPDEHCLGLIIPEQFSRPVCREMQPPALERYLAAFVN